MKAIHIQTTNTEPHINKHEFLKRYLISATASVTSELITFPLDTIKTYRQLHITNAATPHTNINIYQFSRLYDGINAALTRSLLYGGIGMLLYVPIRDLITHADINTNHHTPLDTNNELQTSRKLLAGMLSGSIAQSIAQPTDVAKSILQAHGRHMLLNNIRNRSKPSIMSVWSDIIHHEGIRGLFRGLVPSVQRASLINGVWVSTYDTMKHFIHNYLQSIHTHNNTAHSDQYTVQYWLNRVSCDHDKLHDITTYLLASQFAAFTSALIAAPCDTIKTRMMTQALANTNYHAYRSNTSNYNTVRYNGSIDCLRKTVHNEGITALFKGATSSIIRGSPWNLIYFVIFEEMSQRLLGRSQI